jgi:hypothetical protein
MKIITFFGGLGNTIIEYAYFEWLESKFPNESFFGFYPKVGFTRHNGFELDKHFDVNLPSTNLLSNVIAYTLFYVNKIFKRLNLFCPFISTMLHRNDNAVFHCDYWQDKQFMPDTFHLSFKHFNVNNKNASLIERTNSENSVSVHIRRGDYLRAEELYGGICTEHYYEKAIEKIQNTVNSPFYVFFSDDPLWVKQHYHLQNMEIVDWNTGENSFIDMYLMSQCKYMILANSTFSYCAARLNQVAKLVICPSKWNNANQVQNLSLDSWMKIKS